MKNIKATSEILRVYNNMMAKADKLTDEKLRDEALAEAEKYKNGFDWSDVIFYEDGKAGVKNVLGEILVPAKFDKIAFTYCYFVKNMPYIVINHGNFGMVKSDGSGEMLAPCEYHEIAPLIYYGCFIVMADDYWGLINSNGHIVAPVEHDDIQILEDQFAVFRKDDKKGLYAFENDVYVSPEYDDIKHDDIDEPIKFIRDGKTFYIDTEGNVYDDAEDSEHLLLGVQSDPV